MVIQKIDGNLVFQRPLFDEVYYQEWTDKCLLNDIVKENDYFRQESTKTYGWQGFDSYSLEKQLTDLKKTSLEHCKNLYNFETRNAYIKQPSQESTKIFRFKLLRPLITQFFISGLDFDDRKLLVENFNFDLLKFINSDENNIEEISSILSLSKVDIIKKILYKLYPELAIFYFEIYPYMTLETIESYNVAELKNLRRKTEALRVNTYYLDQLLNYLPEAENNHKILNIIKHMGK